MAKSSLKKITYVNTLKPVPWFEDSPKYYGADFHPNVRAHSIIANKLVSIVKNVMNW